MRATDVVVLDLQVRDGVGLGALGKYEIPVRLERIGAFGALFDPYQAGIHGMRSVGDDAFEKEVRTRLGCGVVLHGPQVVHLVAGAKVGGQQLAVSSRPFEHRVANRTRA